MYEKISTLVALTTVVLSGFAGAESDGAARPDSPGSGGLAAMQHKQEEEKEFEEEFLLLEEADTVFSASRHEQAIELSPVAITVITREQIAVSGALGIPDLLRRVPGTIGLISSPALTAVVGRLPFSTKNHDFLVLVDGKQANIEQIGQPLWEILPVNIEDIERIEVIRGPVSALYGVNALAGVISIYTRSIPERNGAWAKLEAGQWNRWTTAGRASYRADDFGFSLSASYDRAGDFGNARGQGKKVWKLRLVGQWNPLPGHELKLDLESDNGTGLISNYVVPVNGDGNHLGAQARYKAGDIDAGVYYIFSRFTGELISRLEYGGLHLADLVPLTATEHIVDGEFQWRFPHILPWLSLLAGARGRLEFVHCEKCIPSDYPLTHSEGVDTLEARGGVFTGLEIQPLPWLLLNAAGRADYSSDAGFFFSPRVSLTFGFGHTDTLRLAFARSFRKPNFLEKHLHPNVVFPDGGPIQGADREKFREFLSRVGANPALGAEELTAFELGYQRKWAHGIRTSLELFANLYGNTSSIEPRIVEQPNGLPDLDKSTVWFETRDDRYVMLGAELIASWHELDWLWLEASWTMVGLWSGDFDRQLHTTPKNIFSLACDVLHPSGLLGSLVLSGRSEFIETGVFNPEGILEPTLSIHHPNSLHVQGRMGWRSRYAHLHFETGVKFMLPLSLDSDPLHTYDAAGVYTPEGVQFGGTILVPTVLAYVEGEL